MLWDQKVTTNRTNPEIIIYDNEKWTYLFMTIAISGGISVVKIETEKIVKYKYLTIEVQLMWNVEEKWHHIGNRNHLKIIQKIPEHLPGKHDIQELQKTAILDIVQTFQLFVWDNLV